MSVGHPARGPSRAAGMLLAGLIAGVLAPAHAGSVNVRDADGSQWLVTDNPADDSGSFVLRRVGADGRPDLRFGRGGQVVFAMDGTNEAPASVRVDATRRIWMVGTALAGSQPVPVVARFLAQGSPDPRWGVQGKVAAGPNGVAVKPNDLLPLADGSVLVAGEAMGATAPKAVVFHLRADGSLDRDFGKAGLWQRAGEADASTATSLAASADGIAGVAVAVRGSHPGAELWSLNEAPPAVVLRKPLDDASDGEDLRAGWSGDHWLLDSLGGPTDVVAPALLSNRPPAASPVAAPASAASDPGQGGFNPFAAEAASAPVAPVADDDGLPWMGIGLGLLAMVAAIAGWRLRARKPGPTIRAGAKR